MVPGGEKDVAERWSVHWPDHDLVFDAFKPHEKEKLEETLIKAANRCERDTSQSNTVNDFRKRLKEMDPSLEVNIFLYILYVCVWVCVNTLYCNRPCYLLSPAFSTATERSLR